jgi:GNAT superfamily N-acetyltransferase
MLTVIRASYALMDEVRAIINSNYDLYKDIVDPVDLSEHNVDKSWADRNFKIREYYLARYDGQFVGTGSYQNLKTCAYIGYFYIKRSFQRKNFGRGLMQFLELRTMTDKITKLRLFCNPKSTWAVTFYKKVGFYVLSDDKQEILTLDHGVFKPFYEQDSLLMEKILPEPNKSDKYNIK